ncbi:ArsR/SmtB family transcription factor [Reichenbachiella ulvae]|uniref:Metalloregulator ArsR/SmtB family transcription factor n=1 Tax=Reichenbachiella ulvae TaxID=2980104 RepID=A0ABT3CQ70_9BACT|nr:metalloregulator ArsR/SmtB family transcription factor [Reichenbachiella ulvae]MCV9385863.1 metalloregulator ArsR/SmtB family transcription factor [Reichenbachiella ulvae]
MGITKTEGFAIKTLEMAELIKSIGHPARLEIVKFLANSPSCICNDIVDELPLAQPTISRHLSELKKVGLIKGSISGNNICYCLDESKWSELQSYLNQITETLKTSSECCD